MTEKLVIDASVAAKWFLNDETDVDRAVEILASFLAGELELHAPRVFRYEVCSLLAKACGTKKPSGERRITKENGKEAVKEFCSIDVHFKDLLDSAAVTVLEMCVDYSKTFKDMTYLHLAQELDCRFCTADDRLRKAVPSAFPTDKVVLLSEWGT